MAAPAAMLVTACLTGARIYSDSINYRTRGRSHLSYRRRGKFSG
jgi:hypothetical protein